MSVKEEFIKDCIKNRKYLGFSYEDMANCLIDMNANDYKNFELGKCNISKENVTRIIRILCIERPKLNEINLDLDSTLSNDEKEDLFSIACMLEGDFNA